MKVRVLAVGQKMPAWVTTGVNDYNKRLPNHLKLNFEELPLGSKGNKLSPQQAQQKEAQAILAKVNPKQDLLVALDAQGQSFSSEQLAEKLNTWQQAGKNLCLVIGGPNGLTQEVTSQADELLSLSKLTLAHPLVRVVLAEQIYRAFSLNLGHPYHK